MIDDASPKMAEIMTLTINFIVLPPYLLKFFPLKTLCCTCKLKVVVLLPSVGART